MDKAPRRYKVGEEEIDSTIEKLAAYSVDPGTVHLLREILTTIVKLGRESNDKGDLKLVNNALKELRYSFKIFLPYRNIKKVAVFGSARSSKPSAEYKMAEEFARKITKKGYMVV